MKFIWQGLVYNLNAATVVDLREKDGEAVLYAGEHWDGQNDRGMEDILTGEPARKIWEMYRKDAYDLDADFPQPEPQPGDDEKIEKFMFYRGPRKTE